MTTACNPMLTGTPVLETERLILRAPHAADWPQALAFFQDARSHFIRDDKAMTEGQCWRGFCHVVGMWIARGFGMFVITLKGSDRAIGTTGPWHPIESPEPELAWALWSAEVEGRGIAFEAATAARDFAFGKLGWSTAVSYIDHGNERSVALARRLGAVEDFDAAAPGETPCHVFRHSSSGVPA